MNLKELKNHLNGLEDSFIYCCEHHTAPMYIISDVKYGKKKDTLNISLIKYDKFDDVQWKDNTICGGNVRVITNITDLINKLNEFGEKFNGYKLLASYGQETYKVCGFEDSTNCGWWEIRIRNY